jgi:hypothetical protein
MCQGVLEGKFTNHSGRKTTIQRLKDARIPDTDIIKLTGHSNPVSLKPYDKLSNKRLQEMSNILCSVKSHKEPSPVATITSSAPALPRQPTFMLDSEVYQPVLVRSNSTSSESEISGALFRPTSLDGMFAGTTITGGVFNISLNYALPGKQ